jgi:3-deoxy-D-manno-octulosonic-acid transferase
MGVILYWLVTRIYFGAIRIAALFNPKARLFVAGRKNLLARIRDAMMNERRPAIWIHCASLGEFEQGRPILERLKSQYPEYALILTFYSPSGYEIRKNFEGADHVFYLPLDSASNARRFLKYVKPRLCVFVKYEFWYFTLNRIAREQIPCLLVSAVFRKDQPFFKWYGGLHRRMLSCFSHIFVQDARSESLLLKASVTNVSVSGDTRFDRVTEAIADIKGLPLAAQFCGDGKIVVAGSTWQEDEVLLHSAMAAIPVNWKLILVPHEVNDNHILEIRQLFGDQAAVWSGEESTDGKRVLIIDQVGLLMALYQYADVAWVGGGFGKEGVHNVLEAAVYGIPVLHGPVYEKFIEARELTETGGSQVITTSDQLRLALEDWERDQAEYFQAGRAAKNYVFSKAGATKKIFDYLAEKKSLSSL